MVQSIKCILLLFVITSFYSFKQSLNIQFKVRAEWFLMIHVENKYKTVVLKYITFKLLLFSK